jgi:hypothetical protein
LPSLKKLQNFSKNFPNIDNTEAVKILLYGNNSSNASTNNQILTQTINFLRLGNSWDNLGHV